MARLPGLSKGSTLLGLLAGSQLTKARARFTIMKSFAVLVLKNGGMNQSALFGERALTENISNIAEASATVKLLVKM